MKKRQVRALLAEVTTAVNTGLIVRATELLRDHGMQYPHAVRVVARLLVA